MTSIHDNLHTNPTPFFLVRPSANGAEVAPVDEYDTFFANIPPYSQTIGFIDPSALPDNPGWPLRNLLAYLRAIHPLTTSTDRLRILCWRDNELPTGDHVWKSRVGYLKIEGTQTDISVRPNAVGWEKNVNGKLGPRVADLAPMMDPTR